MKGSSVAVLTVLALTLTGWPTPVHAVAGRAVVPLELPPDVRAADGAYDGAGTLHVVAAHATNCVHMARPSDHDAFGPEHPIEALGQPQVGGERRPHLLVDRTGRLFVVCQGRAGLTMATSSDHGETWSAIPAGASLAARTGADVFNATMSAEGTLYVLWAGERDPKLPDDAVAQHLYLASSADGGRSFSEPRRVTSDEARACPCCVPAITCGGGDEIWIAYRSSIANVKETRVLVSRDGGKTFAARQISDNRWMLQGCPMAGPSIAATGTRVVVSWTSERNMYTSASTDGGATFSNPERLGIGRFHQVAAMPGGSIVQVWDEGHQTGLWWRDEGRPGPRIDVRPAGFLVAAPQGRLELIQVAAGNEHHGH